MKLAHRFIGLVAIALMAVGTSAAQKTVPKSAGCAPVDWARIQREEAKRRPKVPQQSALDLPRPKWMPEPWTRDDTDLLAIRAEVARLVGNRKRTGSAPDLVRALDEATKEAWAKPSDARRVYRAACLGIETAKYDNREHFINQSLMRDAAFPRKAVTPDKDNPLALAKIANSFEFARVRFIYETHTFFDNRAHHEVAIRMLKRAPNDDDVVVASVNIFVRFPQDEVRLRKAVALAEGLVQKSPTLAPRSELLGFALFCLWNKTKDPATCRRCIAASRQAAALATTYPRLRERATVLGDIMEQQLKPKKSP